MFVLDQMAYDFENEGKEVIRLTLGKSELPVHEDIQNAMVDSLQDFRKSALVFPTGLPELKKSLSEYYNEKFELDIPEKNFIISPGTSTIFRNLFYLLINSESDEVLLPRPYYALYNFCALLVGAKARYYNISTDTLELDRESFIQNFTKNTKIVVINTPGNPLGNILTESDLRFIDSVVDGNAVVVNDEIYANVCFDEPGRSVMQLKDTKTTFITTNSFSKGYRMYSRRVGYCVVPDEMVLSLTVIQHHTLLTTDPVVQFGALEAIKHQEEVDYLVEKYKNRRDYTMERFKKVELVRAIYSKGGFYITLDCSKFMDKYNFKTSTDLAVQIMTSKQVATVPGSDFGLLKTLRLSYSNNNFKKGIDLLVEFFNEYGK